VAKGLRLVLLPTRISVLVLLKKMTVGVKFSDPCVLSLLSPQYFSVRFLYLAVRYKMLCISPFLIKSASR